MGAGFSRFDGLVYGIIGFLRTPQLVYLGLIFGSANGLTLLICSALTAISVVYILALYAPGPGDRFLAKSVLFVHD